MGKKVLRALKVREGGIKIQVVLYGFFLSFLFIFFTNLYMCLYIVCMHVHVLAYICKYICIHMSFIYGCIYLGAVFKNKRVWVFICWLYWSHKYRKEKTYIKTLSYSIDNQCTRSFLRFSTYSAVSNSASRIVIFKTDFIGKSIWGNFLACFNWLKPLEEKY